MRSLCVGFEIWLWCSIGRESGLMMSLDLLIRNGGGVTTDVAAVAEECSALLMAARSSFHEAILGDECGDGKEDKVLFLFSRALEALFGFKSGVVR